MTQPYIIHDIHYVLWPKLPRLTSNDIWKAVSAFTRDSLALSIDSYIDGGLYRNLCARAPQLLVELNALEFLSVPNSEKPPAEWISEWT